MRYHLFIVNSYKTGELWAKTNLDYETFVEEFIDYFFIKTNVKLTTVAELKNNLRKREIYPYEDSVCFSLYYSNKGDNTLYNITTVNDTDWQFHLDWEQLLITYNNYNNEEE